MTVVEEAVQLVALVHNAGVKLMKLAHALESVDDWKMSESILQAVRHDAQSIADDLVSAL